MTSKNVLSEADETCHLVGHGPMGEGNIEKQYYHFFDAGSMVYAGL